MAPEALVKRSLKTDRRLIRTRISALKADLSQVEKHRELLRLGRDRGKVKTAAIVGYTNAGKSTLLNTLTERLSYLRTSFLLLLILPQGHLP